MFQRNVTFLIIFKKNNKQRYVACVYTKFNNKS